MQQNLPIRRGGGRGAAGAENINFLRWSGLWGYGAGWRGRCKGVGDMQSIVGVQNLYSLNWLERFEATLPAGKAKQKAVRAEIAGLRDRLPVSLLGYHDRLAKQNKPSVVRSNGTSCGGCHLRLPMGLTHEMRIPGRFVICPHCGVFVTTEPSEAQVAESEKTLRVSLPA